MIAFWRRRDEHAIDEGMLLAVRAAVLDVRNRIEVDTIGLDREYDPEQFRAVALEALEQLAAEQDAVAARLDAERRRAVRRHGTSMSEHDYQRVDRRNLKRRARAATLLAAAIREFAVDPAKVGDLVERARQDAWRDVAGQIRKRMRIYSVPTGDDPHRGERIADLAAELAQHADARGSDLGD